MEQTDWERSCSLHFEEWPAKGDLKLFPALAMLDARVYSDQPWVFPPSSMEEAARMLEEDGILIRQENGLYAVTNMGALLFAGNLDSFPNVSRKAVRVIQYEGNSKMDMLKDYTGRRGYIAGFEELMDYVEGLIPTRLPIVGFRREKVCAYSLPAVREVLANAMVHQDFTIPGNGPVVEIFENRMEITNTGVPWASVNKRCQARMRRFRKVTGSGSGWERILSACEEHRLPAPKIDLYEQHTKVTLYREIPFERMSKEEKLRICCLHAKVLHLQGKQMTRRSLRERFGLPSSSITTVIRLIQEAMEGNLIKPFDSPASCKEKRYVPCQIDTGFLALETAFGKGL